jgi:ABC-type phosphate/phosphonate transport system substrate-binding protein
MDRPLKVGAVMYDPKVSVIWEIIRTFFEALACPIDVAFYSTYELQVAGLLDRTIDIAWNSPLAWLDSQRRSGGTCRAVAMRDTDRDRVSYFVAPKDGPVRTLADLRNRTLATGASDSPQATLIPIGQCGGRASTRRPTSASATSTCSSASMGIMSAASATPSNVYAGERRRRARCSI